VQMVLPIVTLEPLRHLLNVRAAQSLAEEIQRENPRDVRIWETPTLAKTARMGHPRSMLASKGGPPATPFTAVPVLIVAGYRT
jgi:hypothetical protein